MSIGENMKKQRLALGMTLEEVAEKIGVTRQTMSRYETGVIKTYSPETIAEIAEALQTTGSYLLGYDETGKVKKSSRYDMPFPTRLRELLNRPEETQGKLAEAIGVQRQSIGQWKDGITSPDINALDKIADYYNVSTEYLLGRKTLNETTPIKLLEKERETLIGELKILRKAVDEINNILSSLEVRE